MAKKRFPDSGKIYVLKRKAVKIRCLRLFASIYKSSLNQESVLLVLFFTKHYRNELTDDAREIGGALYCLRCHDTMGIPICGACHRPIEERVITALGKQWHVEVGIVHRTFFIKMIFSILFVPSVRNHFWVINITKRKV